MQRHLLQHYAQLLVHWYAANCRYIRFAPSTQPSKAQYAEIILQEVPQIKIAAHQLIIWLTQGPLPRSKLNDYNGDWTIKKNKRQQQQQARYVVCHNDDPSIPEARKLKWTQAVETDKSVVPTARICLCKLCISPKCLYYALQSHNSHTGNHHRTQKDKHNRHPAGSSCKAGCAQCARPDHKKQDPAAEQAAG